MKLFLLLVCAISIMGFLGELIFRMVKEKGYKSLKILLMIAVYISYAIVMILIYKIPIFKKIIFLPVFMGIGFIVASGIEFCFGLLYNRILKLDLWHYEDKISLFGYIIPLNIMNQVSLKHSILYMLLSPLVCYFIDLIYFLTS